MNTLADLHHAVQSTLASKRLGTPVFVRYSFHGQETAAAVVQRLARATKTACDWLGQVLDKVYATGSVKGGQVSLMLECRGGATAVVTWIRGAGRGHGVDILLLGNNGALYHDFGNEPPWDETLADSKDPADKETLALIDRALASGRPESAGGKP